jgi:hypothetical protein
MLDEKRINELICELERFERETREQLSPSTSRVSQAAREVAESWSGSTLGHHASIYYDRFQRPPFGRTFNAEWGTQLGMPAGWSSRHVNEVVSEIHRLSGVDLDAWQAEWESRLVKFREIHDALLTEVSVIPEQDKKAFLDVIESMKALHFDDSIRKQFAISALNAHRPNISRDLRAVSASGVMMPGHVFYDSLAEEVISVLVNAVELARLSKRLLRSLTLAEQARVGPLLQTGELMSLQKMTNNPFLLQKRDGRTIPFKGLLTKGLLVTFQAELPVEDGDVAERTLPSGMTERYVVLDSGFHSEVHRIGAHFQMMVQKENASAPPSYTQAAGVTNIYNVQGPNARVNVQSTDSSRNIANVGETELFQKLRSAIESGVLDGTQRTRLLVATSELEQATGTPLFAEKLQQMLAGAANCMTILTPFLPALGQLAASALGS